MGHLGQRVAFVSVARLIAPHGLHGELRAEPLTDDPARLADLGACRIRRADGSVVPAMAAGMRPGPRGTVLLRFQGIDDRDQAEAVRGAYVEIPAEQVRPLPENRYYLFEVVGLEVVDEAGQSLGRIVEVMRSSAHDIWVVRRGPRRRDLLLPATREVIRHVDTRQGRVVARVLPGLDPEHERPGRRRPRGAGERGVHH